MTPTSLSSMNDGGENGDGREGYGLASTGPRLSPGNGGSCSGGGGGGSVEPPAPSIPFSLDTEMNWTATGELVPRRHLVGAGGGVSTSMNKVCWWWSLWCVLWEVAMVWLCFVCGPPLSVLFLVVTVFGCWSGVVVEWESDRDLVFVDLQPGVLFGLGC